MKIESKSILAKLLATENISVQQQNIPTAAFDPTNRVLYIPNWKDMSISLQDLLIGHEVGHVVENHSNERISSQQLSQTTMAIAEAALESQGGKNQNLYMSGLGLGLQYGVLMPYGRAHENEADVVGQELMARSGFKPKASIRLWQNMAALSNKNTLPEFMSTHPSNETRINELTTHLAVSTKLYKSANNPTCYKPKS